MGQASAQKVTNRHLRRLIGREGVATLTERDNVIQVIGQAVNELQTITHLTDDRIVALDREVDHLAQASAKAERELDLRVAAYLASRTWRQRLAWMVGR